MHMLQSSAVIHRDMMLVVIGTGLDHRGPEALDVTDAGLLHLRQAKPQLLRSAGL